MNFCADWKRHHGMLPKLSWLCLLLLGTCSTCSMFNQLQKWQQPVYILSERADFCMGLSLDRSSRCVSLLLADVQTIAVQLIQGQLATCAMHILFYKKTSHILHSISPTSLLCAHTCSVSLRLQSEADLALESELPRNANE
eukprot:1491669-Amphidinium_carterae.1